MKILTNKIEATRRDSFTSAFIDHHKDNKNYKNRIKQVLEADESTKFETTDVTTNDISNLLLSPEEVYKIFKNKLHFVRHNKNYIDKKNKKLTIEGINYFNQILNESIDFYERVFYEKLYTSHTNHWNKDKNGKIKLKNYEEVVSFLTYNANTKYSAIDRSNQQFLLKIMRTLNDFNIHQKNFDFAEENFDKIQRESILKKFKTKKDSFPENEDNIKHLTLRSQSSRYNSTPIYFILDSRIKTKDRIIIKNLSNSKYNSTSVLADIYGFRCQVKDEIDAIRLLEYYWKTFGGEISHKKLFGTNIEEVKKIINESESSQKLDPKFKNFLLKNIDVNKNPEKKNGENYKDVKIIPTIKDQNGEEQKIEIQITLEGNSNNSGTAHHGVYEVKALIEAEVRGRGFTNLKKVDKYINDVIQKNIDECVKNGDNPDILYLGGFSREQNFDELELREQEYFVNRTKTYIKRHIENDFLDGCELKYPEKRKSLYTTKTQLKKFQSKENKDLYPSNIELR